MVIEELNKQRVDKFTRWLVNREAQNRKKGLPGYLQTDVRHYCGTPACTGGYLSIYPPFRKWARPGCVSWVSFLLGCRSGQENERHTLHEGGLLTLRDVVYAEVFASTLPKSTALQAANRLRKLAGLKRLLRADIKVQP